MYYLAYQPSLLRSVKSKFAQLRLTWQLLPGVLVKEEEIMLPKLALVHLDRIPAETFVEFQHVVDVQGVKLHVEEREDPGPYASVEWLIPTAVFIFVGKAYFDGFLKEMGKDHYALLKQGIKSLHGRLLGPKAPKLTTISTGGKTRTHRPYSLLYSLVAEAEGGFRFKLLLKDSSTQAEYDAEIEAFLTFLEWYHAANLPLDLIVELEKTPVLGQTIFLAFNSSLQRVQPVDPTKRQASAAADLTIK